MKNRAIGLAAVILCMAFWVGLCFTAGYLFGRKAAICEWEEERVVTYDTIRVKNPEATTSAQSGCETYKVAASQVKPVAEEESAGLFRSEEEGIGEDTVAVELPIVKRHYRDSLYEAWVSGPIDPRLDSLLVVNRHEVMTLRAKNDARRWHIGLTAGYGYTPKGFQPYVGVGITYNFY